MIDKLPYSQSEFHEDILVDAKGKGINHKVSATTHSGAGRDQRLSGLIQAPSPDRTVTI